MEAFKTRTFGLIRLVHLSLAHVLIRPAGTLFHFFCLSLSFFHLIYGATKWQQSRTIQNLDREKCDFFVRRGRRMYFISVSCLQTWIRLSSRRPFLFIFLLLLFSKKKFVLASNLSAFVRVAAFSKVCISNFCQNLFISRVKY